MKKKNEIMIFKYEIVFRGAGGMPGRRRFPALALVSPGVAMA
ncbi:hypothetical protein [Azospirillum palustre]|nr:hypothetical protein [Azospirillum palustre]